MSPPSGVDGACPPGSARGGTELVALLRGLTPALSAAPMVYAVASDVPGGCHPFATVREPEGLTLVLTRDEADALGLAYDYAAALITLRVHSALASVGLTAAVSAPLAQAGISCNVIAGAFHDHLLVDWDRRDEAMDVLGALGASRR